MNDQIETPRAELLFQIQEAELNEGELLIQNMDASEHEDSTDEFHSVRSDFSSSRSSRNSSPARSNLNMSSHADLNLSDINSSLELNFLNSIKCLYTNPTSLNNSTKLALLQLQAELESPDIIFIAETWFNDQSSSNLEGFECFRQDRSSHAGGLAIYVRDGLNASLLSGPQIHPQLNISLSEQIWLQLDLDHEKLLLGCIYRPNLNARADLEIKSSLKYARQAFESKKFDGILIAGDFNYPLIKWSPDGSTTFVGSNRCASSKFIDTINNNFYKQNVFEPTFIKADGDLENTLDLVLTDPYDRIEKVSVESSLNPNAKQGHCVLKWNYQLQNKKNYSAENFYSSKLCYKKGNYANFDIAASDRDWHKLLDGKSAKDSYQLWSEKYHELCTRFIPPAPIGAKKNRAPWISNELLDLTRYKKKLWYANQNAKWKIASLAKEYTDLRNKIKKLTRDAIRSFEERLAND